MPATLFVPPLPPRDPTWLPAWRTMFGQRMRSVVHGLPEPAFDVWYASGRLLNIRFHIVNRPATIGKVLLERHANYLRPELTRKLLRPSLGNGLLTAEGEGWRTQRKLVAPTFSPPAVAELTPLMAEEAERRAAAFPAGKARVDLAAVATETTMAIISRALFSGDARLLTPDAGHHITRLVLAAGEPRFLRLLGYEAFDLSPRMAAVRASRRWLRATLGAIVDERGPDGGADDFFGGLMRSFYAGMPPAEARALAVDNAITFYAAGHETTAVALAWSVYLLAAQPELQEAVRAEAVAALADPATLPDRVPLLRRFLDETLRLYPPAAQIVREAAADDDLDGIAVRKGDHIVIYPWAVQRHRRLWDNPDAFDIERFGEANKPAIDRFQYLPFGAGPRICVGMRFAIVEALIILAHWLAARRFALASDPPPFPTGRVTLRPGGGMPLAVEPLG